MKLIKICLLFVLFNCFIAAAGFSSTVNAPGADGKTPLSIAMESNNLDMIKLLIKNKMDPNTTVNEYGETLLMWACRNSEPDLVDFLVKNGANPNATDIDNENILSYCDNKPDILKLLVNSGLNPNSVDSDNSSLLHNSIQRNDIQLVKLLISKGANINLESNGDTPVASAVYFDYPEIAKLLIESGANPNTTVYFDEESDETLIEWAAENKYKDIVKLLLEKGASFEDDSFSIIYQTIKNKDFDNLKLMIEKGLRLNDKREATDNETILNWAIKNNYDDIALLVIDKGADVNLGDIGFKPINLMMENKKTELIKAAVEKGFDINQYLDKENNLTLLSWAVINKNLDFAKYLIGKKVDINKLLMNGTTVLMIAVQNNDLEMVKALLAGGADPGIKNSAGKTANDLTSNGSIRKLLSPDSTKFIAISIGSALLLTLLFFAVKNGKNKKFKLINYIKSSEFDKAIALINKGARLDTKDDFGSSALFHSVNANNLELVKLLIEKGVDINSLDSEKNTALNIAIFQGKENIAHYLLDLGANTSIKNSDQYDAIALSILDNHKSIAEKLIFLGNTIYNRYLNGKTLLHLACECDNLAAVKYLLEKEFDININDEFGKTPYSYAVSKEVKSILKSAGATY